jgi:hypothetical protein
MKMFEAFTGERVRVYANTLEEAYDLINAGNYEFIETDTILEYVSGEIYSNVS